MKGKRKALIISISEYNDKSLPKLDFCKNDGEEMYNTLTELDYKIPNHQKIIGKTNKKTMEDRMIDFFRNDVVDVHWRATRFGSASDQKLNTNS